MSLPIPVVLAIAGGILSVKKRKLQTKKKWAERWLLERSKFSNSSLLKELKANEPSDYRNYLRMDDSAFNYLLDKIRPGIQKQNTVMRDSVSAEERLIATLRFLATGKSYEDLKYCPAISPQLLSNIIRELCTAIYEELKEDFLKFPRNEQEWRVVAAEFKQRWNFDTCCGAIDGKRINIIRPPNSGSYYYNYKGKFSTVLLAVVNANYEFTFIHTGTNGRISDGGVLQRTKLYEKLMNGSLNLPSPEVPNGTQYSLPFVFVADEAFPLLENVLKPYAQRGLTSEQGIFNYRLSRARRIVENAFGIMASRFRVLQTDIAVRIENVDKIVLATCVLHNYLRRTSLATYSPRDYNDVEDSEGGTIIPGNWRQNGSNLVSLQRTPRGTTTRAKENRDQYKTYFNNEGSVPFQERMAIMVNRGIE